MAGTVTPKMTMAETPEARKEASEEARPAWAKRRGAYLMGFSGWVAGRVHGLRIHAGVK